MPRLKQPDLLQKMAMHRLVEFLSNRCHQLSIEGCLNRIYEAVIYIQENICPCIPWDISTEFYKEFFKEYNILQEKLRPNVHLFSHQLAVIQILMDRENIRLRLEGPISACLHPGDGYRLHGLRVLDMSYFYESPWPDLRPEILHLQDLRTFICLGSCTNADLKVIGKSCPNLEVLNVMFSREVTDQGLRHLNSCSKLRIVCIAYCSISYSGIIEMLSAHQGIELFRAWPESIHFGFDCFTHSSSVVYPLIKHFEIDLDDISNKHLRTVVRKFRNLTSLGICGDLAGDLCTLKSLSNLTHLDLMEATGFTWEDVEKLLTFIGANICKLQISTNYNSTSSIDGNNLNFIYKNCGKIEHLEFDYEPNVDGEKLVIPPFQKLKYLQCVIPFDYDRHHAVLEFGQMPELENLTILRFYMTTKTIQSMILDNTKFPKLMVMHLFKVSGHYDIKHIREVAKRRNLDFTIVEL